MTTVKSKTDRVTFISQKSDWLGLGPIKEVKMNKTLDVVQFYFEDGSIGEVHACNSGGLVLSPIVNVDTPALAGCVPRLVVPSFFGDDAVLRIRHSTTAGVVTPTFEITGTPTEEMYKMMYEVPQFKEVLTSQKGGRKTATLRNFGKVFRKKVVDCMSVIGVKTKLSAVQECDQ